MERPSERTGARLDRDDDHEEPERCVADDDADQPDDGEGPDGIRAAEDRLGRPSRHGQADEWSQMVGVRYLASPNTPTPIAPPSWYATTRLMTSSAYCPALLAAHATIRYRIDRSARALRSAPIDGSSRRARASTIAGA